MLIVKAGALAAWASKLSRDARVAIGNDWECEEDDSNVTVTPIKQVVHKNYLYEFSDGRGGPGIGFITLEPTFLIDCECHKDGQHLWKGTPIWRLGG